MFSQHSEDAIKAFEDAAVAAVDDDKSKKEVAEYIDIFRDIYERSPEHNTAFKLVLSEMVKIPDIKAAAGLLNLSYERQEPEAIKIFRKMVIDNLCGVQVMRR
jgi:hypothetical protein